MAQRHWRQNESRRNDKRGNSRDRAARKHWLLRTWDTDLPTWICRCVHGCGTELTYDTVQADRIEPGGSYKRSNVQPSCAACNRARGDDVTWTHPSKQTNLPAAA